HNYLNGILARLELRVTGADEALMLDSDGHVAEGATSNIFFADEVFLTNSTWEVRPVATVDGIAVDGDGEAVAGPLTTLISRL
ncbi:aminotransferase class IV, partial [Halorubrum ejinorense]